MSERVVKLLPLTEFTVAPPTERSITTNGHDLLDTDMMEICAIQLYNLFKTGAEVHSNLCAQTACELDHVTEEDGCERVRCTQSIE